MKKQNLLKNQEGFTLVEIIAVLIILGILAAVAVPRYIDLEESSRKRGLEAAVAELNGRESLVWAETKISGTTATASDVMQNLPETDEDSNLFLGEEYEWESAPDLADQGSTVLNFQGQRATVTRSIETPTKPAIWKLEHIAN